MKTTRIILILFAAAAVFNTACDDLLSDLLKFNSQWYPREFSIYPSDPVGNVELISDVIEVNIDSALNANGVSKDALKSVRMSDAKVTVLTEGYNFDPLDSIKLFMETPNLGLVMVAWLDSVPEGVTMIELELNKDDLKAYLDEDSFMFTAKAYLETQVTEKVDFLAEFRYVMQGGLVQ